MPQPDPGVGWLRIDSQSASALDSILLTIVLEFGWKLLSPSPVGARMKTGHCHPMRLLILTSISTALLAAPPIPKSISIQPVNPLLFGQGATQTLVVVGHYADGSEREIDEQSQFSSAKTSVATVDSHGVITAHASGGAPIHVTYKNLSATTTA